MSENRKYFRSYSRFEQILTEKSITPYRVATDLHISPMSLSDWKNGISKPKTDKLLILANYFGVGIEELLE